jgi:xylulokinase
MYLGLDLGTTNVKTLVVDEAGRVVGQGSALVARSCTADGSVEQDIEQIWSATCRAIGQVAEQHGKAIRAVGVSSQGGALQLLDAQDRPSGRVISWLDARGQPFDRELVASLGTDWLATRVGHGGSTMTLGQVLRIGRSAPQSLRRPNRLGFVGDVIVGRLCGRRAHDATSLGIALLYNPWLRRADPDLLARLGLGESQLPDLLPATTSAGSLRPQAAERTGLRPGIPVSPAVHDQYAAALGAGAIEPGDVNFGAGTAWVLLAATQRLARPVVNKAFVCSHLVPDVYGQLLSLGTGGAAIEWAMRLAGEPTVGVSAVDALLDSVPPCSDGLRFCPPLASLEGIRLGHGSAHLVRAVVEGLVCELARHLEFLHQANLTPRRLLMCGSAALSRNTPQIVADVAGLPVTCVAVSEVSALGAAMLARALTVPAAQLAAIVDAWPPAGRVVTPGRFAPRYQELLAEYLGPLDATLVESCSECNP